jgi:hypothetical protein
MPDFPDSATTVVITTIYVVRYQSPILFVFHFADGMWQFSGGEENLSDSDFLLLGLSEAIALDASLAELADLPLSVLATRETSASEWVFSKLAAEA